MEHTFDNAKIKSVAYDEVKGCFVASINNYSPMNTDRVAYALGDKPEEAEANARLIAAAPALLDEGKANVELIEDIEHSFQTIINFLERGDSRQALAQLKGSLEAIGPRTARAALKLAKGE